MKNFEILNVKKANKKGSVVVYVKYDRSETIYNYVRKIYNDKSFIISGYKFFLNKKLEVVDEVKLYDVTSNKKRLNSNAENDKIEFVEEKIEKVVSENEEVDEIDEVEINNNEGEIKHKEFETIKSCIKSNIPVYLTGPAGSGKNYTIKKIAEELDLEFYFTNSIQQEYKITGFIDAGGKYHETEFYKAFKNGGLFFLDELDASIPEVLVLLNAAIANGYFEFPNGKIEANENFRVIAAGNTKGNGADEQYTGRMVLDSATLDRFVVIEFDYDKNVELSIAKNDKDLVNFVHSLRRQCEISGMRYVFSYRCIEYIVKLKNTNLDIEKVLLIAIFKGMKKDEIRMFDFSGMNNMYTQAAVKLAA